MTLEKKNPEILHWLKTPWNLTRLPPLPPTCAVPLLASRALHWVKDLGLVSTLTGLSPALPEAQAQLPASPSLLASLTAQPNQLTPWPPALKLQQGHPLLRHWADTNFLSVTLSLSAVKVGLGFAFAPPKAASTYGFALKVCSWELFS